MPKQAPDEYQQVRLERAVFQGVFGGPNGNEVLAWIGNYCGAWSQEPSRIKPELVAFWNTLLGAAGIVHTHNLRHIAQKLMEAANDEDLAAMRKAAATAAKESRQ